MKSLQRPVKTRFSRGCTLPRVAPANDFCERFVDPVAVLTRTAEVARAIYEGEGDALGLLRGASAFAPSLRAVEEEFDALRDEMQRERIVRMHGGGRLAPTLSLEDARRIVWALTNREMYRSFVAVGGWSAAR